MSTTLAEMRIGNPSDNVGASGSVRYYASDDFTGLDGTKYKGGVVGSKDYFLTNTWTVVGDELIVPAKADFPTTADASPSTAKITAALYDTRGRHLGNLFEDFAIPADPGGPHTLLFLQSINARAFPVRSVETLSRFDFLLALDEAISAALGSLNIANVGVLGRIETATIPGDTLHPKAVLDDDPRMLTGEGIFNVKSYGAVCDGVTDDTVAVTAAKTAAEATGNGAILYFPGLCLMRKLTAGGELLLIRKGLVLQGVSKDMSGILASTDTPDDVDVVRYNPIGWPDAKGFAIRDMTLGSAGRCEGNVPPYQVGCAVDGGEWLQGPNISARYALVFDSDGAPSTHPIQGVLIQNCLLGPTAVGAVYGTDEIGAGTPTNTLFASCEIFGPVKTEGAGDSITFLNCKQYGPGYAHEVTQVTGATKYSIIAPNITNDGGLIYHRAVSPEIIGGIIELYKSWRGGVYGGLNDVVVDFAGDFPSSGTIYQPLVLGTVVRATADANLDGVRFGTTQFATLRGVHLDTPLGKFGLVNSANAANSLWERNQQFGNGERWSDPAQRLQLHTASFATDLGVSNDQLGNLGLIGNARFSAPSTSAPARLQLNFTDSAQNGEVQFLINNGNLSRLRQMGSTSARPSDLEIVNATTVGQISLWTDNVRRWILNIAGHLITLADNVYDIGASGASRPRTGYFGTSVVTPKLNLSGTVTPSGSADAQGDTGDVRYDANFVYVKTATGWKRSALSTF